MRVVSWRPSYRSFESLATAALRQEFSTSVSASASAPFSDSSSSSSSSSSSVLGGVGSEVDWAYARLQDFHQDNQLALAHPFRVGAVSKQPRASRGYSSSCNSSRKGTISHNPLASEKPGHSAEGAGGLKKLLEARDCESDCASEIDVDPKQARLLLDEFFGRNDQLVLNCEENLQGRTTTFYLSRACVWAAKYQYLPKPVQLKGLLVHYARACDEALEERVEVGEDTLLLVESLAQLKRQAGKGKGKGLLARREVQHMLDRSRAASPWNQISDHKFQGFLQNVFSLGYTWPQALLEPMLLKFVLSYNSSHHNALSDSCSLALSSQARLLLKILRMLKQNASSSSSSSLSSSEGVKRDTLNRTFAAFMESIDECEVNDISKVFHELVKLGLRTPSGYVNKVLRALTLDTNSLELRNISQTFWAVAKLKVKSQHPMLRGLLYIYICRIEREEAGEKSNIEDPHIPQLLQSLVKLQIYPNAYQIERLALALLRRTETEANGVGSRPIANTVWSLGCFNQRVSQGLAEKLLEAFFKVLEAPDCLPMHIAQVLTGLAMLGFELSASDLSRLMERFNSFPKKAIRHRDLSNVIAAVGALNDSQAIDLGVDSDAMMQGLVGDFVAKMEPAHPKEIIKVLQGFSKLGAKERQAKDIESLCNELYLKCTEGITRHQVTYEDLAAAVYSIASLARTLTTSTEEEEGGEEEETEVAALGDAPVRFQNILRTYKSLLDLYLDKISAKDPTSICHVMQSLHLLNYWPEDSQVAQELVSRVVSTRSQDHFNSGDIAWMISTLGAITGTSSGVKHDKALCLEDLYRCFQSKRENATPEDIALVETTMANL